MKWLPTVSAGKSGAREVALTLLLLWTFLLCWAQFIAPPDSFFERKFDTVTTAIFTFALGAFGIAAVMNRLPSSTTPHPGQRPSTTPRRPSDDKVE